MSTKAHAPQALEFEAGYGTCVAVAVPKEVVLVYDEPEITVDVTEELPVPVDDPDEPFYALVGLDTKQHPEPTQYVPVLLVCIDNSMN